MSYRQTCQQVVKLARQSFRSQITQHQMFKVERSSLRISPTPTRASAGWNSVGARRLDAGSALKPACLLPFEQIRPKVAYELKK